MSSRGQCFSFTAVKIIIDEEKDYTFLWIKDMYIYTHF